MQLHINYLNDQNGKLQAVQIPIAEWQKLQERLLYYEQKLKIQSDFKEAFNEVSKMQKGEKPKQTLGDFLDETI